MKLEEIDSAFSMEGITHTEADWTGDFDSPYRLYGLTAERTFPLNRMDPAVAAEVSANVKGLAWYTAGVRLRFRTDAAWIALKAQLSESGLMNHMPRSGTSGFDLYVGDGADCRYVCNWRLENDSGEVTGEYDLSCWPGMKTVTIYFPLFNGVRRLAVGLPPRAAVEPAPPYAAENPVVFYGSSITHGACASRPGNSYPAMLGRMLDTDIINLGFSGSALGEPLMADYISSLPRRLGRAPRALVLDYDHNAPNPEHLEKTHYPFYKTIRQAQPDLPILMVSKPNVYWGDPADTARRRAIIEDTYQRALSEGDGRVAFLDGGRLFDGEMPDSCVVDGTHPNDLGFMRMAETMAPVLRELLRRT